MRTHVLPQWGSWPLNKIDHAAVQAWVTEVGRRRSPDVVAKCYRTIIEVSGQTSFKPFPKSTAGRRTVPLPLWLAEIIQEHRETYPLGENGLMFPNAVGKPLRRTLFRSRVWRPALVRAGMLGTLTIVDDTVRAGWVDATGAMLAKEFPTEREAMLHIARWCAGGLRFHDLRHCYATWLVDDGVPPNMVARVMGHEKITTTLQLYTRRTDDESRILDALTDEPGE